MIFDQYSDFQCESFTEKTKEDPESFKWGQYFHSGVHSIKDLHSAIMGVIRNILFCQPIQTWIEKEQTIELNSNSIKEIINQYENFQNQTDILSQDQLSNSLKSNSQITNREMIKEEETIRIRQIKIHRYENEESPKIFNENKGKYNARGPYKKYSSELKGNVIQKVLEGEPIQQVCQSFGVARKNINRWIKYGNERKKGGGRRRMDCEMETQLVQWCFEEGLRRQRPVSRKMIQQKALELTRFPEKFKASKGWTDKFVRSSNIRKRVINELLAQGLQKQKNQIDIKQLKLSKTKGEEKIEAYIDNETSFFLKKDQKLIK